ncbi:Sec7-domain-containing protein [Schizophyllum commune Tattone D]|nr:Sec7-domain-containing protein [Schizophyllum commune Tattone D]
MSTAPLTSFPPSAVPYKHVLLSEILSVTSVMRKNSRWATSIHFFNARDTSLGTTLGLRIASPTAAAHSPGTGTREADLMAGFQEVKRAVREVEDISGMPLTTLLAPFFAIIRSPLSTGPITSAALSSLHNFFLCGLISPDSVNLESALAELSNTVSHCKFEASDSSGDEVVLLKIMTVIQDCMCSSMGNVLGDVEVCEMLETVLTTCCQMRLSEVLRRSAENAMQLLVRTVFSRLHTLDPEEEERKLAEEESDAQDGENKLSVSASSGPAAALTPVESPVDSPDSGTPEQEASQDVIPQPSESTIALQASTSKSQYGLPSIIELLRVLVNVLDPNDQSHTDSTRLIVLSILNAAIEAAGPRIMQFPSLEALVLDGGCKYLFLLARSENMHVLHSALRTITALFVTMSPHLKLQQELFLTFSIDRLATPILPTKTQHQHLTGTPRIGSPRPGTPAIGPPEPAADAEGGTATPPRPMVPPARGETRGLMLETLGQISRHPSFMVDLYTNYDCDINCENVFERLVEFLTKAVYPPNPNIPIDVQHKNTQYLCLDLLLAFVNDMATRGQGKAQPWPESNPPTDVLLQTKAEKKLILAGAAQFNRKPKAGIAFLEEHKLIYQDLSDTVDKNKSLAMFLKSCNRIDKKVLGEFLAKPENLDLLKTFMSLIDFKGKDITDAVRELLNSFRLPGESQQISRVTEIFAETYLASGPPDFKSADPIFVLTFSIIMLNTDLHSPQIRKRMTFEDYSKNLRGVNDGQDFTEEYLRRIYENIRKQEIVMSEEHTGQLGFEHAWQELLTRSRAAGEFMICNTNAFDLEMFKTVWRPVISTIAYAFISFDDDYIIQRAIAGFRQCATLAGQFNLPDVFDYVVVSLSQATSLLPDTLPAQVPNYPVVDFDGQSVTVSGLSVNFGTNFKGQLAAVVLFNIVNGNGNALREGWTQIFEMFQNLFLHSLLPTRMLQMEDFLGGVSMIPLRGAQPPRPAARGDGGLLSALSSYLMTPYSASNEALVPDATDSDVENTLCTIDCIASCRLDELYSQIMQLDLDALIAAVRALEALAHERTVARLKLAPEDVTEDGKPFTLPYDPASVFLLETMVSIACQAPQYIEETWPIVFGHLSALLSSASQYSALLVERAVVGLLRICLILAVTPSLRDQIYVSFDLLAGLPRTVTNSVAEQIVAGVVLIVRKHGEIIQSQTEWSLVSALLRSTISHPEAGRECFELVSSLLTDGPSQAISVDSFSSLVMLLDEFATYAGQKVDLPQHRGRRGEQISAASSPVIDRGKKAVDFMVELQKHISSVASAANLSPELAWRQLSLPLISALSRQSTNPSREIRHNAVAHLQRVLLGPHVIISETQTEDVFNRILFPLLDELLKPEVLQRDPRGMQETRLRASTLLCKAFMHFEVRDSQTSDLRILWIEILDLLDRLMNADKGEQLYEAVPESLKNVLLVMHATGILVPPPADEGEENKRTEGQQTLWNATQVRMERFLPGFLREVIPAPEPVAKPPSTPQTPVEPAA